MQVVILCGGKGTRLRPYTEDLPKAMIPIGEKPIVWHIMKTYSQHGHKDFILCLGHMGKKIREYFEKKNNIEKDWHITFVDTGLDSTKGERLKKVRDLIKDDDFFVVYGDDLSDVDVNEVLNFHKKNNKIATLTAINPISQFGILEMNENEIISFKEKPKLEHWINGGYFVFNKKIFDYLKDGWDLEKETFEQLVKERQINAFKHDGFWMTMNTFKDIIELKELWDKGELQNILYSKKKNN
jgi:glucose-1-phosphate cytidylyltransferase